MSSYVHSGIHGHQLEPIEVENFFQIVSFKNFIFWRFFQTQITYLNLQAEVVVAFCNVKMYCINSDVLLV